MTAEASYQHFHTEFLDGDSTLAVVETMADHQEFILLIFATGAKRTEARMQNRPGYRDYQQRVPLFLPRPPRSIGGKA